jgi:uncharacterized phiE125 gp8 family phage protein
MAIKQTAAPTVEPLTLEEAKNHLRVDDDIDEDDALINNFIAAARQDCEKFQNRAYVTQTWELWLDAWPDKDYIEIPLPPLQTISSVKYYDTEDTEATLSSDDYFVDAQSEPGRVVLNSGNSWPGTTLRPANGVCVTFVAGYGDAGDVPKNIKSAILLLVGHFYEHREDVITGISAMPMPHGCEALLWKERIL